MTTVEKIKAICKERKIPISRLERACDFANGYISQLRKGSMPDDRLRKVADYLGVSVDYLMYGEEQPSYYKDPETAAAAQEMYDDPDMRVLYEMKKHMKPEVFQIHVDHMKRLFAAEHPEDDDIYGA